MYNIPVSDMSTTVKTDPRWPHKTPEAPSRVEAIIILLRQHREEIERQPKGKIVIDFGQGDVKVKLEKELVMRGA